MELIIGTPEWSTWSMRPWLALTRAGVPFTQTLVNLREQGVTEQAIVHAGSPTGLVPVLKDGDLVIWDSLAICDYIAEIAPQAGLWPKDLKTRALARAATAEMHAGFHSLRGECPMDLAAAHRSVALSEATHRDVRRLVSLWSGALSQHKDKGPFLFGDWSIADAFFTPVATRFRTYGVALSDFGDKGLAGVYAETLLSTPEYLAWEAMALARG